VRDFIDRFKTPDLGTWFLVIQRHSPQFEYGPGGLVLAKPPCYSFRSSSRSQHADAPKAKTFPKY
jgi:hypothetical protein